MSYQDSNLDKQNQKLLCYHYTIGQFHCAFFSKSEAKVQCFHETAKFLHIFLHYAQAARKSKKNMPCGVLKLINKKA